MDSHFKGLFNFLRSPGSKFICSDSAYEPIEEVQFEQKLKHGVLLLPQVGTDVVSRQKLILKGKLQNCQNLSIKCQLYNLLAGDISNRLIVFGVKKCSISDQFMTYNYNYHYLHSLKTSFVQNFI